jgi:phthalate 4,5-dioxygenase
MLSKEDNELLTRVGPGTAMGALFRQYWLPTLLSAELPGQDCPPTRVRILGEDLVAFRDTGGRVGMLADHCAHRGASLFFGRNEEGGLRCVYHGWKYDVNGRCLDMPNEPPESNFKDKIRHVAYSCEERSGVIWTYMGPRQTPPPFPALEWAWLPEKQHVAAKITEYCNWLQILEGDVDTVHTEFLHARLNLGTGPDVRPIDRNPRIEIAPTAAGFAKGARRNLDADRYYWRIYQFMMPAFVLLPATPSTILYRVTVPIDDEHTTFWNGEYNPLAPLTEDQRAKHQESRAVGGYAPATSDPLTKWRTIASHENDYMLDSQAQRTTTFSGVPPIKLQDVAMTESMGPVLNRTTEHLGTTDAAIIQMRRCMLNAVKALRDHDAVPPGVDNPEAYGVRSATAYIPKDQSWLDASGDSLRVGPNRPLLTAGV